MNKIKKTPLEIAKQIQSENPKIVGNLNEKRVALIIREALKQIKTEIDTSSEGVIKVPGFGNFHIRQVDKDDKKLKRVIFQSSKPKK